MSSATEFFVDFTNVARRSSGIERIAKGLFSPEALAPLPVTTVQSSGGKPQIIAAQWLTLPALARANPQSVFLFPGYPPSLLFPIDSVKTVVYVHDIFLLTRPHDLNAAGKYYLAPSFRRAVKRVRNFLCNSETTKGQLRGVCHPDATIVLYRPEVSNVFGLAVGDRAIRPQEPRTVRFVSVGTVEPRKNFRYGASICEVLSRRFEIPVEYHIIGRRGWGDEWETLAAAPNVQLHGYLDEPLARAVIQSADFVLCTSHDEGLGLPLLELQYAGLPVIAPEGAVFREVLDDSGLLVDPLNPEAAAATIAALMKTEDWRGRFIEASQNNVERWNAQARLDRNNVLSWLKKLGPVQSGVKLLNSVA